MKNKCRFWGENDPKEFFIDVGCTINRAFCDPEKCSDYQEIESYTPLEIGQERDLIKQEEEGRQEEEQRVRRAEKSWEQALGIR